MTVVNYSVQDIISPERRVFVGTEWFKSVMRDDDLHGALLRQIAFSLAVLLVEIPLGIALALSMPAKGWQASAVLVLVAISLLIPWNVVGTIWQIYGRDRHRPARRGARRARLRLQLHRQRHRRLADGAADGRVALDAAGRAALLRRPARDPRRLLPGGAASTARRKFAVFRYIQLPKLRGVLMIAVLLRFMDSFMIYTEPFVLTGGGPGNATTFLSPVPDAEGGRPVRPRPGGGVLADLLPDHPAALLHPLQLDAARRHRRQGGRPWMTGASRSGRVFLVALPRVRHPAGVLDGQHVVQDERGDPERSSRFWPQRLHLEQLPRHLHRRVLVLGLHQLA